MHNQSAKDVLVKGKKVEVNKIQMWISRSPIDHAEEKTGDQTTK